MPRGSIKAEVKADVFVRVPSDQCPNHSEAVKVVAVQQRAYCMLRKETCKGFTGLSHLDMSDTYAECKWALPQAPNSSVDSVITAKASTPETLMPQLGHLPVHAMEWLENAIITQGAVSNFVRGAMLGVPENRKLIIEHELMHRGELDADPMGFMLPQKIGAWEMTFLRHLLIPRQVWLNVVAQQILAAVPVKSTLATAFGKLVMLSGYHKKSEVIDAIHKIMDEHSSAVVIAKKLNLLNGRIPL